MKFRQQANDMAVLSFNNFAETSAHFASRCARSGHNLQYHACQHIPCHDHLCSCNILHSALLHTIVLHVCSTRPRDPGSTVATASQVQLLAYWLSLAVSHIFMYICSSQCLEILAALRRELDKRGFLKPPVVFVHPSCGAEAARLKDMVKRLQGKVADAEGV